MKVLECHEQALVWELWPSRPRNDSADRLKYVSTLSELASLWYALLIKSDWWNTHVPPDLGVSAVLRVAECR